ncbi:DUF2651 family protein [Lentibacillus sediminis]|uniref:DUF2651 family protein n=1 Tax=Lentibacillus sediminis TaxID=1940529 RepID=UPI000C1BCD90|nr:DUF2651 family protein [Lentibacillus sediminis]
MSSAQLVISILFVFPAIALIMGAFGCYILKNMYITPIVVALIGVVAIFAVFNSSFLFWAILYTLLSFLSGFIVKLFSSEKPRIKMLNL